MGRPRHARKKRRKGLPIKVLKCVKRAGWALYAGNQLHQALPWLLPLIRR